MGHIAWGFRIVRVDMPSCFIISKQSIENKGTKNQYINNQSWKWYTDLLIRILLLWDIPILLRFERCLSYLEVYSKSWLTIQVKVQDWCFVKANLACWFLYFLNKFTWSSSSNTECKAILECLHKMSYSASHSIFSEPSTQFAAGWILVDTHSERIRIEFSNWVN